MWNTSASFRAWLGLLRVHQYVKNALIFVPLLTMHRFELGALWTEFVASDECKSQTL
jgi:hypothetical protein